MKEYTSKEENKILEYASKKTSGENQKEILKRINKRNLQI